MRTVVGTNNVDFRIDYKNLPTYPKYATYAVLASQPFSIADIDTSDVIVVLGSDLVKEHPNEYLRVRKASNFNGSKIYTANSFGVKSSDVANLELIYQPGTEEVFVNGLCLAAIEEKVAIAPDAATLAGKIAPSTLSECAAICGVTSADLRSARQVSGDRQEDLRTCWRADQPVARAISGSSGALQFESVARSGRSRPDRHPCQICQLPRSRESRTSARAASGDQKGAFRALEHIP